MCMPNIWGGAVAPQRTSRITRECVCTNLFGLTHPLVYVLPCQATGPPAHREGGAQRSLPLHHAPLTGGAASRLAGSSPALRLNVFIIVLPVDSKAINGRSTDYLDGRSVFLPAHHPGDEGIGARLLRCVCGNRRSATAVRLRSFRKLELITI